jgi:prepilin-type N-terminal cleavage/methylation domain-containing protein
MQRASCGRRFRFPRRAFSLVEVIVVCALLAIVVATIVPRMVVVQSQREAKAVLEVEDLLRMYAFRNSAGTQQVGLSYNPSENALSLWIFDLNPEDPDGPRVWQEDRLSDVVQLPDGMVIARAEADGIELSDDLWNIPTHPDGSRPRIQLDLVGAEQQVSLLLESFGGTPIRSDDPIATIRAPRDLDAEGAAFDPW